MSHAPTVLRIAILSPVRKLFDYLLPTADLLTSLVPIDSVDSVDCSDSHSTPFIPQKGVRVLVPFGKQKKIGIIVDVTQETDCPLHKLKPILAILDTHALFPASILTLIHWASGYYQSSLGEVFEAALPKRLRQDPTQKKASSKKKKNVTGETSLIAESPITSTATSILSKHEIPTLNSEQNTAVETVLKYFGKFQTFLLNGVTGSGKTEVYTRLVEQVLLAKKQALILVPEIGLTPQLLARFQERFQVPIAVLHSGLTEKQRFEAWQQAKTHEASIIIGTRSTVFVPLAALGIIIIDEEHDLSFKQQEGFRYHARDLAIMRASLEKCPIVLGSATPSLETLQNVHAGRFQSLPLTIRAGNAALPTLQILDIRHKKLDEGLSQALIEKMREHLNNKGQVLIFLNRRGFAPVLMCFECGWTANCTLCDARMTLHFQQQKLQCHHCETSIPLYSQCPNCQHTDLKPVGVGTERIEQALLRHFPEHTIARIDRDTTRKKNSIQDTIEKIHQEKIQILLGTQMITKGHHFPNITLVAILDIDQALFSTDFRSLERMGQLITQVAGRAGRAKRLGQVILQTSQPKHLLLNKLLEEGYGPFSQALLTERQAINLPPYSYQVLIRAQATQQERAIDFLHFIKNKISKKLLDKNSFKILGPIPAPMERRIGKYRTQLLLQSANRSSLQKVMKELVFELENLSSTNGVQWSLDVDPVDLF
jgi:primosomal protein N' (replication factor Y)